ncbi:D-alanyl-D-alanine carboxypeptidase [Microvirga pudoricolor]|uniref:D-alanyl-D-alanine carboxypeptidase n=1 Tax=Microvirga pudoricolor TaxID=2778729 RepID=UPI00194DB180|nr:D-alanyl-D-alanine carboxypeptidase [Microvirga pudoricolor]MBM6594208.1 D-alanyl-D-alanine carboxypeptidase [Microvirga pudoricolor]
MSLVRVWAGHGKTFGAVMAITASFAIALSTPAEAARKKAAPKGGGYSPPYATIVVDAKTGKVLQGENEDAPRIPASLTKVMSLYLLFEQLERGRIRLDTPLTVSAYAASQPPTKIGLRPGSTIDVEDAIKSMVTLSANDVSVVVAENIAGSEDAFADMMTKKARSLGMSSSTFYNPHGLPHSPPNITTARDLSILGRAIQDRFPKYFSYFSTRSFQYGQRTIRGHNRLLGKVEGVDGIKTGYTRLSGFNLLTSVNTDTRSVVAVVLGGRSGASRDQQMTALVQNHLSRAYAGNRTAPPVLEGSRPTMVADASPQPTVGLNVETTATTAPAAPVKVASATPAAAPIAAPAPTAEARKPLDLNALRPVVASAAGASSTTTPSSTVRWQKGQEPLPLNAQAYAALQPPAAPAGRPSAPAEPAAAAKTQERVPAATAKAAPAPEPKASRPNVTEWVIQLGATDDEDKAKDMLASARSRSGKLLAKAAPFTEKVNKDGSTLYRARFSGFNESGEAEKACKALKRSGIACFATRS